MSQTDPIVITSLPETEQTPEPKTARAKKFVKSTFTRFLAPAAVGAGAYLLLKKLDGDDETPDTEDLLDTENE